MAAPSPSPSPSVARWWDLTYERGSFAGRFPIPNLMGVHQRLRKNGLPCLNYNSAPDKTQWKDDARRVLAKREFTACAFRGDELLAVEPRRPTAREAGLLPRADDASDGHDAAGARFVAATLPATCNNEWTLPMRGEAAIARWTRDININNKNNNNNKNKNR